MAVLACATVACLTAARSLPSDAKITVPPSLHDPSRLVPALAFLRVCVLPRCGSPESASAVTSPRAAPFWSCRW